MSLSDKLNEYQIQQRYSTAELADLIGVDPSALSLVKRGKRGFGVKMLTLIAKEIPELEFEVMRYIHGG